MPDQPKFNPGRTPEPRTCWKCAEDLSRFAEDAKCPRCGLFQPIEADPSQTDTVFQRMQGSAPFSFGSGSPWRPSADGNPGIAPPHMTAEQYTDHQDTADRVYRWCGCAFLLLGSVGFTFAAAHSMKSHPWMGWTLGIVASALFSVFLLKLALRGERGD